jgi:signal transduction histidine kinase/ligand-binding sensor domain-containing protein/DNA-binding response OmpR family regulator
MRSHPGWPPEPVSPRGWPHHPWRRVRLISWNFCILCLLAATVAFSQPVRFEHFTTEEGLPEDSIRTMAQDDRGFLWLGTQAGLVRYDGYEMLTFLPDATDSTSIGCRIINDLCLARNGDLWIGSIDNGVSRYSARTGTFTNWWPGPSAPARGLPGAMVQRLCEAPDGTMLVVLSETALLARIHPDDGRVETVSLPAGLDAVIQDLRYDTDGNLWLGTTDQGVVVLDPQGTVLRRYGTAEGLEDLSVSRMVIDSQGRWWLLGGWSISRLDQTSGRVTTYAAPAKNPEGGRYLFLGLVDDDDGDLWIAAAAGLLRFSPRKGTFQPLAHDPGREDSLANGPVISIFRDRSGIVWVGCWHAGLNKFDPRSRKFESYRAGPSDQRPYLPIDGVTAVVVDRRARLWVGTGTLGRTGPAGGLAHLDPGETRFRSLDFPDPAVLTVYNLVATAPDTLWLGTNAGLWLCLPDQGVLRRPRVLGPDASLVRESVIRSLLQDSRGHLWLGTHAQGLVDFDPATGTVRNFVNDPADTASLSMNTVTCLFEDASGRLWVGTDLGGLNLLDPFKGSFQRFYDALRGLVNVTDMVDSRAGGLWLGTVAGLLEFDPERGVIRTLGRAQGLPNDMVASVLPDRDGHLWLSTAKGIVDFDPGSGALRTFDVRDGLPSNDACFAHFNDTDGTLYFGGSSGLFHFHPDEMKKVSTFEPPAVLTGIQVFDRAQKPVPGLGLGSDLPLVDELTLPANLNHLTFSFASLDFAQPGRLRYRYQLEGHDGDWREPLLERKAEYNSLSPGSYRFRVQGTNRDGVWSAREATIGVRVLPPWWATGWAWAAYVAAASAVVVLAYRQILQREKRRADLGIRLAEARKLQELDEVKSTFFSNISHEFRTPLTLILGPLARLEQDPGSGNAQVYGMMRRNAVRLGQLINQLFDVSRLENQRYPLNWQPLDAVGLCRNLGTSFASLSEERGLKFTARIPEGAGTGEADADILEKILGNLLSNAIRYAPMGAKVWLQVDLGLPGPVPAAALGNAPPQALTCRQLTVEVGNTGSYIPPEERTRIFERFYQAPSTDQGARAGSGIGLALVRELTELLGGKIALTSEPDAGTVFIVTLPLYQTITPVPVAQPGAVVTGALPGLEPAGEAQETADDCWSGSSPLVLVVEDDADLRSFIFDVLRSEWRVMLAKDGEEGIETAFAEVPDLVISDVMMPRRDGFQLCAALKGDERTNHIPVILLTAKTSDESRLAGLKTGADCYLAKPFEPEILLAHVRNLIEQRRLLQGRYARTFLAGESGTEPIDSRDALFLQNARDIVLREINDPDFNVASFSREAGLSRSQLHRKLTALTGLSGSAFIRSVRLHRAAELLRAGYGNVTEVAMETGFQSLSNFSRSFREQFGVTPSRYLAGDEAQPAPPVEPS